MILVENGGGSHNAKIFGGGCYTSGIGGIGDVVVRGGGGAMVIGIIDGIGVGGVVEGFGNDDDDNSSVN